MKPKRFEFQFTHRQFALLPSVGITYHSPDYKFYVAAMWLNMQCCFGCFRRTPDGH